MDALTQAAGRVEAWDYTQAIDCSGRDEFAPVCAAFNRMQEHLLAEQEKSAACERSRTDLVAGLSPDLRIPPRQCEGGTSRACGTMWRRAPRCPCPSPRRVLQRRGRPPHRVV